MVKSNYFRVVSTTLAVMAAGAVLAILLLGAAKPALTQTAVAAPSIDYPANNSFSADGVIQFSGPSHPDMNVDLYEVFDNGQNYVGSSSVYPTSPCGPTGCDCEAGCYGIEWYWSISLTGVADGPHTYYAVADDGNGNVSDPSNSVTVVVDRSIPPTVDFIHPYDGETTTGPVGEVSAVFSEKMDPNTLTSSTFTLVKHESDGSTTPVDATDATVGYNSPYFYGTVSYTVLLKFPSYLEGGTKYTATIKGGPEGVKDETGFPLANDKVWSFTTATWPTVTSVSPSGGATQVPTTSNITATFTKHMMWGTFRKDMKWYSLTWPQTNCTECIQLFTLVKEGSTTPVDATVTYNTETRKATMDPSGELQENTTYTAAVKGEPDGIQDAWDNPLAEDKIWSFTTAAVAPPPDTSSPTVQSVSPSDGATQVPRGTIVTAQFSEEVEGVTAETFVLGKGKLSTSQLIASGTSVSYEPATKTATLDPYGSSETRLARCQWYTAKVTGGVKDKLGTPAVEKLWSFKTRGC